VTSLWAAAANNTLHVCRVACVLLTAVIIRQRTRRFHQSTRHSQSQTRGANAAAAAAASLTADGDDHWPN